MTKLFLVDAPETLREMAQFVKEGNISSVAAVWSAARRKQGGTCAWDGRIMVSFHTSGRNRQATIFRITTTEKVEEFAFMKYAPALAWCSRLLRPLDMPLQHRRE